MDANAVNEPGSAPAATPHGPVGDNSEHFTSSHLATRTGYRALRAQAVIDIADDCRLLASQRGTDLMDDMLDLYSAVSREGARELVADAIRYVRADSTLRPSAAGTGAGATMRYLGRASR